VCVVIGSRSVGSLSVITGREPHSTAAPDVIIPGHRDDVNRYCNDQQSSSTHGSISSSVRLSLVTTILLLLVLPQPLPPPPPLVVVVVPVLHLLLNLTGRVGWGGKMPKMHQGLYTISRENTFMRLWAEQRCGSTLNLCRNILGS